MPRIDGRPATVLWHCCVRRGKDGPLSKPCVWKTNEPGSGSGFQRHFEAEIDFNTSFDEVEARKKFLGTAILAVPRNIHGGDEGSRTPVRKCLLWTFFGRSRLFTFPHRIVNRHTRRLGSFIYAWRPQSLSPSRSPLKGITQPGSWPSRDRRPRTVGGGRRA